MSVVLLYPRGCDFKVVRTCAQNTWGLANVRFYSEFTSLEPRYLYRIRDPGLEGELTRGYVFSKPCVEAPGLEPSVCRCYHVGESAGAVLGGLDGRDHAVSEMSGGEKPDQT